MAKVLIKEHKRIIPGTDQFTIVKEHVRNIKAKAPTEAKEHKTEV